MKDDTVTDAEHRRALDRLLLVDRLGRASTRAPRQGTSHATPTTGRTSRWSATRRRRHLSVWTVFSVLFLIAGIALLGWHYARHARPERGAHATARDRSVRDCCASRRRCAPPRKYFWLVIALFLVADPARRDHRALPGRGPGRLRLRAVGRPAVLAHPHLAHAARRAVDRHGLARARACTSRPRSPATSRKFQRLGVNFLFVCLLVIVVGSFAGQWFAVMQKLGLANNFWFGHQGWEYVDLGRFWQSFLFVGLLLWLALVGRALWPALRGPASNRDRSSACCSCRTVAIGLFYGAGLMWGEHTHISRWSSTGAGGSCTCGSKASSRCSPPR